MLTSAPRCPTHTSDYNRATHSGEHRKIYATKRWKTLRRQVLREQPYCAVVDCNNLTTDVDHIQALEHGGAPYDRANVQGLCKRHHSQKTQREVFGRK